MADSTGFSLAYTAGLGAVLAALGAVGLLFTGERSGVLPGQLEVIALLGSAIALLSAGAGAGMASEAAWPRVLGLAAVVVLVVLRFLTLGASERGSVLFFEVGPCCSVGCSWSRRCGASQALARLCRAGARFCGYLGIWRRSAVN